MSYKPLENVTILPFVPMSGAIYITRPKFRMNL